MTTLKLAIFDCDGTLVDSQRSIVQAMTTGFEMHGLTAPPSEEILRTVGLPLRQCVHVLLPNADDATLDAVTQGYSETYRANRLSGHDEPPLYPHTLETLEALAQQDILLAIATGKSRRGLEHTLRVNDLLRFFVETRTADDGPGKPNPDILLDICACTGVRPEHAVIIGDTTFDIEMGGHAKMPALGVNWGYHSPERLLDAGAFAVLESWRELDDVLRHRFAIDASSSEGMGR